VGSPAVRGCGTSNVLARRREHSEPGQKRRKVLRLQAALQDLQRDLGTQANMRLPRRAKDDGCAVPIAAAVLNVTNATDLYITHDA
jgi:hypothetical protein